MNTAELINALCVPQNYPHPVEVITTIETHISVVFLTGPFAYKLKKPVDFGFLNFSTLSNRHKFCDLEVKLNRRYAPDLYIDVVPIYLTPDKQITFNKSLSDGHVFDYLVKMNQFDPNQVLGRRLQNSSLSDSQVEALAFQIANFHQNAEGVDQATHLGAPKTVLQPMLDNFPTLTEHFSQTHNQELDTLYQWTLEQFSQLKSLIEQRKTEGFVKACHGDLHIDNITLINNQPMLFDGIEFNENFRWIDVISDLAFLLIDLDFREQPQLRRRVLSLYLSQTGDYNALKLLSFYQVYRAMVRAKITTLRAKQVPADSIEHSQLIEKSLRYIKLALSYTKQNQQPKLILLQGVSGSGKSHFANQLLTLLDATILNSDRVRKRLFGIAPLHRVTETEKQSLYSNEMNQKVYGELLTLSEQLLKQGLNVVVDATFLKATHRQKFQTLCATLNQQSDTDHFKVSDYVIYIETDEQLAAFAIQQRQLRDDNPSDADVSVMERQLSFIEAPKTSEQSLTIDAKLLRQFFPKEMIQEFLNLPI